MYKALLFVTLALFGAAACATSGGANGDSVRPAAGVDEDRALTFVQEEVSFRNGEITLVGTLSRPEGAGPHAAVVLLSGSGPQDRDGATPGFIEGYHPSRFIAEHLARSGIASLRYDERGVGASAGDHGAATSSDLAGDAEAAIRYLRTRSEIDPQRIGILGHSEGSLLAASVAARDPEVAFVISLAGPAVPGYELLVRQNQLVLQAMGADEVTTARVLADQRRALDLTVSGEWQALEELLYATGRAEIAAMPEAQRALLGDPEGYLESRIPEIMRHYQTWMREFLTHDPAEDWARIRVPVLAIFGELDMQVEVEQNRKPLERALAHAGNTQVTVLVLPQANHLFQAAQLGTPVEYASLPPEFLPGLLETISDWIAARVAVGTGAAATPRPALDPQGVS